MPKATRARIQTQNLESVWLQSNAVTTVSKLRASGISVHTNILTTRTHLQEKGSARREKDSCVARAKKACEKNGMEMGLKK